MALKEEDFEVVVYNPEFYNGLINEYLAICSKETKNLFWSQHQDRMFYAKFRVWAQRKYNCFNDGSNCLYFKTEQDYVWFNLKHG